MIVFQLLVYSCVSFMGIDGDLLEKTCSFDSEGWYTVDVKCVEAGAAAMMTQTFSDLVENKRVESFICYGQRLN